MFSSFTLLITADDFLPLNATAEKWKDIVEIVSHYKEGDYYFVELFVMDENRGPVELLNFVRRHFDYIALHQSKSTYIFTEDKKEFKEALNNLYTKAGRDYFFYDMLTIEERYHALMVQGLDKKLDIQAWIYNSLSKCYYALNLNEGSKYLFEEESCLDIMDNETGEITEYDIIEGLEDFKFHIGILGYEKLEKSN